MNAMNSVNNMNSHNSKNKAKQHLGSSEGSADGSSPCLSRDSSTENYTDSTGTDLQQFLIDTLHKNQKDRMFLLKIEQELTQLVRDTTRQTSRFSQMTSYNRMLVHRVAAFYGFDHNVDSHGTSVVVNKTDNTRIPDLKFRDHIKDELLLHEPKKSILKRDSSSFEDSSSQLSFDGKERSPERQSGSLSDSSRSKSFEEREELYEKARARIFNEPKEEFSLPANEEIITNGTNDTNGTSVCSHHNEQTVAQTKQLPRQQSQHEPELEFQQQLKLPNQVIKLPIQQPSQTQPQLQSQSLLHSQMQSQSQPQTQFQAPQQPPKLQHQKQQQYQLQHHKQQQYQQQQHLLQQHLHQQQHQQQNHQQQQQQQQTIRLVYPNQPQMQNLSSYGNIVNNTVQTGYRNYGSHLSQVPYQMTNASQSSINFTANPAKFQNSMQSNIQNNTSGYNHVMQSPAITYTYGAPLQVPQVSSMPQMPQISQIPQVSQVAPGIGTVWIINNGLQSASNTQLMQTPLPNTPPTPPIGSNIAPFVGMSYQQQYHPTVNSSTPALNACSQNSMLKQQSMLASHANQQRIMTSNANHYIQVPDLVGINLLGANNYVNRTPVLAKPQQINQFYRRMPLSPNQAIGSIPINRLVGSQASHFLLPTPRPFVPLTNPNNINHRQHGQHRAKNYLAKNNRQHRNSSSNNTNTKNIIVPTASLNGSNT